MKFLLKEFQKSHVATLLKRLTQAKRDFLDDGALQAITVSAPTASGKTVMVTSLIERVLFGKGGLEDFDDPTFAIEGGAVFLWLSDSPQLNQQSAEKMAIASSSELVGRLERVDASFDAEFFEPGRVYFLNSQKLSVAGLLTKKSDQRSFSIWETINNTIRKQGDKFYVVIDEAHRGMRQTRAEQTEARTIVQKFIFGSAGELEPAPLIIGLSATPDRFDVLLSNANRTRRAVNVPPNEPREEGLIKDSILISHTEDSTSTDWTLFAAACGELRNMSDEWERYSRDNNERDIVKPILVVQVEDSADKSETRTSLAKILEIAKQEGPLGMTGLSFAHCFESGKGIDVNDTHIRYIEPHRIESDEYVRVVIFKMALTTGWDCPRAEVMMSFRRADDATYIAQLVGRIVRTPLARRMEGNDLLNSVMLFLPRFDRTAVEEVVARLASEGDSGGAEAGRTADFQTLRIAQGMQDLLQSYVGLPTYSAQEGRKVAHVRRAQRLAIELARDGWEDDSVAIRVGLRESLLRIADERRTDTDFAARLSGLSSVTYRLLRVEHGVLVEDGAGEGRTLPVSEHDVEAVFSKSFGTLSEELAMAYVRARFDGEDELPYWRHKLELFLLSQEASIVRELEGAAERVVDSSIERRKPEIQSLPTERQAAYRRIIRTSRNFRATNPAVPDPLRLKTDRDPVSLSQHLFVDSRAEFRASLNPWEASVLAWARKQPNFAGWLRNYPRKPWSVAYTYLKSSGTQAPAYPDFVIFRRVNGTVIADLLEPHAPSFSDSVPKAQGLARFAEEHGVNFGRIEWIKVEGGRLWRLNVNTGRVRSEVLRSNTDAALASVFDTLAINEEL